MHQSISKCFIHLLARPRYVLLHLLELVLPAEEDVAVVLAGVQVLQQLSHNLPLWRVVLLPHRTICCFIIQQAFKFETNICFFSSKRRTNKFESVFVEVVDEFLRVTKVQTVHSSQGLIFI